MLREAFNFFRLNADRRYSARSLMSLQNAADAMDSAMAERRLVATPIVVKAYVPFEYDEDTEVKKGGTLAMGVLFPNENGRVMLAVAEPARRQHLGRTVMQALRDHDYHAKAWVHRENTTAQMFLLSVGFMPVTFNSQGAIQYAMENANEPDASPLTPIDERQYFGGVNHADRARPSDEPYEPLRAYRRRPRADLAYEEFEVEDDAWVAEP